MTNLRTILSKLKTNTNQSNFQHSIKQITFFSGGGVFAQVITMVHAIVVARALGPDQLGVYSGLYAILGISITIVNFGLDQWTLKEAHNYVSVRLISGKILGIKMMFGVIWGLLCFILLPISRPNVFNSFLVILAVADVLSDVFFNTILTAWTIQRKIKQINIFLLSSRTIKLILLFLLIYFDSVSPESIIGSRLIISFIFLLISLLILKPYLRITNFNELIEVIKGSTVFGFSDILAMIYANIDIAILSYFSISDTGLYSPASGLILALFIIPNSVFIYLLPHYSKEIEHNNKFSIQKSSKRFLAVFIFIGLILSLVLFVFGEFVVSLLLDNRYMATGYLLRILSPIMLFKSIAFGLALIIVITGNQRKRLLPQFIVSVLNISFNLLLIPNFGLIAVAWIYTISEMLLMIGYSSIAIKVIKNEKAYLS